MISVYMTETMFLPGQYIAVRGRIGTNMYYILRGEVEVPHALCQLLQFCLPLCLSEAVIMCFQCSVCCDNVFSV